MKHVTPFVISKFTNPSGEVVYRVYARIEGQRFRKNFPTLAEAEAERQIQEVQWLRNTGTRPALTRLTEDQLHEAEAVYLRLAGQVRSLSFYVEFALTNYREPERLKALADAVADYVTAKEHEFEQDHISVPQMDRIRWDLKRLSEHYAGKSVAELTVSGLAAFLEMGGPSMKTYNNRRGILSTFFKFCFQRGWIAENPIPKVPHYRIRRKRSTAQTITAAQAAAMTEYFETFEGGRWVCGHRLDFGRRLPRRDEPQPVVCCISRGRKRVIVFTDNKTELRARIGQSGDRGLALEMKFSAAGPSNCPGLHQSLPAWTRRATAAAERVRLHEAVMRLAGRNANHLKTAP